MPVLLLRQPAAVLAGGGFAETFAFAEHTSSGGSVTIKGILIYGQS
jgi:hypothetical protein